MIGTILWIAFAVLRTGAVEYPARVVSAFLSWQTSSLPASRQADVKREVNAIWSRLGIDVQWRLPRVGEPHVTVIVQDIGQAGTPVATLGWVHFVGSQPTAMLYASAAAAASMAQAGRTEEHRFADDPPALQHTLAARLLGRAIAHELGHYLLGTREHSSRGLMRSTIYAAESVTKQPEAYGLDAVQRQTLQRRMAVLNLYARSGAPAESGS